MNASAANTVQWFPGFAPVFPDRRPYADAGSGTERTHCRAEPFTEASASIGERAGTYARPSSGMDYFDKPIAEMDKGRYMDKMRRKS